MFYVAHFVYIGYYIKVSDRDPKKYGAQWAYPPETKGGHTIGGFEWALSILNYEDPPPQTPDIFRDSAEVRQRRLDMRSELRSLVSEWETCNRDFYKVFRRDRERGVALQTGWLAYLGPDGKFSIGRNERTQDTTPRGVARTAFASLIGDPNRDLLGGPCDRCGRYYKKNRSNQKRFCGRRCAHLASATKATANRLKNERDEKLKRAWMRIAQWETLKQQPKQGWKKWICANEKVVGLTPSFLTRVVNSGELRPPRDARHHQNGIRRKNHAKS